MTPDAERLLSVARRLAERCPAELGSEIAVTGSVGAGLADSYSDVEMLFLGESVPAPAEVEQWLTDVGATDVLAGSEADGVWAWCRLDGVEIDPYWAEVAPAKAEVEAIAGGDVLEHGRLAFAHVLAHSIPLRTAGVLEDLARRCAAYPDGLARRLIEDALDKWEIPAARIGAAARGDAVEAIAVLHNNAKRVLRIVFALNERWEPPHWKWLRVYAQTLAITPPRLVDRIEAALLTSNLVAGAWAIEELARDALTLVSGDIDSGPAERGIEARLASFDTSTFVPSGFRHDPGP